MIIITIGGNRQPKYQSLPDRGWKPMFKPTIYGEGTIGWFNNKRRVFYYRCNEWRGGEGWRTDCGFRRREDGFIQHLLDFHGCNEAEAREYIKTPYNLDEYAEKVGSPTDSQAKDKPSRKLAKIQYKEQ